MSRVLKDKWIGSVLEGWAGGGGCMSKDVEGAKLSSKGGNCQDLGGVVRPELSLCLAVSGSDRVRSASQDLEPEKQMDLQEPGPMT